MNVRQATARAAPAWQRARRALGVAILLGGSVVLLVELAARLASDERLLAALGGGLFAALATALGTIPVLLSQRVSQRTSDAMLGFGAGVMLAATSFSLVVPGLAAARADGAGPWAAGGVVGAGIALGAALLLVADRWLPHDHDLAGSDATRERALRRAWVFVGAIALHNFPEGLAIGVAFAGTEAAHAQALATGIAIQDVPEGLVVALALRGVGYGRGASVAVGMASGLIEPIAAVLGATAITIAAGLLPWGLAFAAGAMLYAICHEAIPGAHQQGNARPATVGVVLGFVLMMLLDTALSAGNP
jgi:ZIP family zinc transporter